MFPPEPLLTRMQHALLPTLVGGVRDLPVRKQTIRSTIEWSYRLLTPAQQQLLARLSVFVGGWTLEAAEFVCAEEQLDVSGELQVLIEHSLVRVGEGQSGPRYSMLETVREFAVEQYGLLHGQEETYHGHALFFVQLAARFAPLLFTDQQRHALDILYREVDNLRAALRFATAPESSDEQARLALTLAASLELFWENRITRAEGLHWLIAALTSAGDRLPELRASALFAYGELAGRHGLLGAAESALQTGLVLSREAGTDRATARCLHALAELSMYDGDYRQGLQYAMEGQAVAEQAGDLDALGWTTLDCAIFRLFWGDLAEAAATVRTAIGLFEQVGDVVGVFCGQLTYVQILLDTGETHDLENLLRGIRVFSGWEITFEDGVSWRLAGDLERAQRYFEQEIARVDVEENPLEYTMVSSELGIIHLLQGDPATARAVLYRALPALERISVRGVAALVT